MVRRYKEFRIWGTVVLAVWFAGAANAQTVRIALQPVISGLNQPLYFTSAKDGTNRRFIVEQPGRIRVMQPGATTATLFLDISNRIVAGGERGLLGLAFHPQFAANRRFFVNYTRQPDGATVVAEYRVSAANPNVADTAEAVWLVIPQPFENHNGGMIEFGPDGLLYIGMGDGGSGNDPGNRAQNLNELLGKMLRLDVERPGSAPSIFAYGFRNPWRFSFDRLTGQLYAADVGQSSREEIDIVVAGGNYGWRVWEGTRCTNLGPAPCSAPGFIPPIADYANTGPAGRCSITGGYVYRGTQASLPYGAYIFGDFCSGEILMLKDGVPTVLLDTTLNISSFGEDEAGEICVVALGGSVQRITNPDAVRASTRTFTMTDRGAASMSTAGSDSTLVTGYSRIQASAGSALPSGLAIFGYQQRGVTVSEASAPASPLIQSGRVYAEVNGSVNTGIAIANPNSGAVTVSFFFTDATGRDFGQGATTIPANQQIARFLNEAPFNGGSSIQGTFTFSASALVSAIALRGFTNERSEFLLTTLPVVDPGAAPAETLTIPHFADGGGWTTQVVLVNPTDTSLGGTIQFLSQSGQTISTAPYAISPRSSTRQATSGSGTAVQVGSVRVSPASGGIAPSGLSIFSYRIGGVTVTEAGVPALRSGTAFRTYVESSGGTQAGIAIANPSTSAASVDLEMEGLSSTLNIPPGGQTALFLTEISGFRSLPSSIQGVLRITSSTPISLTSLRGRTNERREFLITTTTPVDESATITSSELLFPHFAEGAGYSMQFVLFGRPSSGTIYFFGQSGQPVNVLFR